MMSRMRLEERALKHICKYWHVAAPVVLSRPSIVMVCGYGECDFSIVEARKQSYRRSLKNLPGVCVSISLLEMYQEVVRLSLV